jgi:hypothetical protein
MPCGGVKDPVVGRGGMRRFIDDVTKVRPMVMAPAP